MLAGRRILLGVTGSIAAYKSVFLLRLLQKAGAEVRVMMTSSATRFVGSETFRALTRTDVPIQTIDTNQPGAADDWVRHIHWAEWADLLVIAPCTANTLGKIVHGLSDNMLTATVMSARCPILICPVMDGGMFRSPAVTENLAKARSFGFKILEPDAGYLASGLDDEGRLPEPESIIEFIDAFLDENPGQDKKPWTGKKVLVTAGPTREFMDPVRFISNPSSGKMGWAMAEAARNLGADVTLLHGKVNLKVPDGMNPDTFVSAADLFGKVKKYADHDVIVMTAAVSDYTPEHVLDKKMKKDGKGMSLSLNPTQDILKWLGERRKEGQLIIGFAMETHDLEKNARRKLKSKNIDWIVANTVAGENEGFESDANRVTLIGRKETQSLSGPKTDIARHIFDFILKNEG